MEEKIRAVVDAETEEVVAEDCQTVADVAAVVSRYGIDKYKLIEL